MTGGWPITWPEYTELDPETGELVLRPAVIDTDCGDCGCAIGTGDPHALVDREVVCAHCAPEYDVRAAWLALGQDPAVFPALAKLSSADDAGDTSG